MIVMKKLYFFVKLISRKNCILPSESTFNVAKRSFNFCFRASNSSITDFCTRDSDSSRRTGLYSNFLGIMNVALLLSKKRCLSSLESRPKKISKILISEILREIKFREKN